MAADIKIKYLDPYNFDIVYAGGDYLREEGLETAVLISIFTDRRADEGDPLDDVTDKRGWWGDQTTKNNDKIGSKIWLLDRAKTTQENLNLFKKYLEDCLAWLVDDEVALKVEVNTFRNDNMLCFEIKIYKLDGSKIMYRYDQVWEAQIAS